MKVLKEIVIVLILLAIIAIITTVLFYKSIPTNKIIPSKVAYNLPEDLQEELDKTLEEDKPIIVTYTVDEKQLDSYQRAKAYVPGKADPFAEYTGDGGESATGSPNNNGGTSTSNTGSTGANNSTGNSNNNTSQQVITNK